MNSILHHQLDQDEVLSRIDQLRTEAQRLRVQLHASGRTPQPQPGDGADGIETMERLEAHVARLQEQLEGVSPVSGAAKIQADHDAALERHTRALGLRREPPVAADPAPASRQPRNLTEEVLVRQGKPLPALPPSESLTAQCRRALANR